MQNILIQKETTEAEPIKGSDYDLFYQELYQKIKINLEVSRFFKYLIVE